MEFESQSLKCSSVILLLRIVLCKNDHHKAENEARGVDLCLCCDLRSHRGLVRGLGTECRSQ